jgi:hypothetical protein
MANEPGKMDRQEIAATGKKLPMSPFLSVIMGF